jgi:hypothetical protein
MASAHIEVVIESPDQNTELELLPQRLIKIATMGNEKKSELLSGFQKFFMCSGTMNRLNQTVLMPRPN